MRWEITKQAWALAREKFPNVKRLFVELPNSFRGFGDCPVFDLEEPEKPIGKISYHASCDDGTPIISLSLDKTEKKASLAKPETIGLKVVASVSELKPRNAITASEIIASYPEMDLLGEQLAFLIAGHEDGLVKTANTEITDEQIEDWFAKYSFPPEAVAFAESKLEELGVKIAKKRPRRFQNYDKVRVVDPRLMEYNEGARIVSHRRDKDKNDWYQVIVDGSEKPIWLNEKQIAINEVGTISNISAIDKDK